MGTEPGILWRALSVAGLLCLIGAYLANQRGRWHPSSRRYLLVNAAGAGVLAAYSAVIGEWVFVALEGFWCVASLWALRRPATRAGAVLLVAGATVGALAWGCGREPGSVPPGERFLLADLSRARLLSCPDTNLPDDVRALAQPVLRVRHEPPMEAWTEMPRLSARVQHSGEVPPDVRVWSLEGLSPPPLSEPVVLRGSEPLQPVPDPEAPGFLADAYVWFGDEGRLVGQARARPAGLSVEYDASRDAALSAWERFSPGRPEPHELLRRATLLGQTRDALLLPAPGALERDVVVPAGGALRFAVGVADAAWLRVGDVLAAAQGVSDGVLFALEVLADGAPVRVWSRRVRPAEGFVEARADLSRWAGRRVALRFVSGPGASSDFDYALWAGLILEEAPGAPPTRPSIVLIDVDTLRADRLSCYGNPRPTSPRLDAWATRATVFTDAWSTASWTLPATASMLTGLAVHQHGVLRARQALPHDTALLAERLAQAGYETAAWGGGGFLSRGFGFDRGFHCFRLAEGDLPAGEVVDFLRSRQGGPPLFLFVHTYAVHMPYAPDDRFATPDAADCGSLAQVPIDAASVAEPFHRGERPLSPEERQCIDRRYDAGVARLDASLGPVLDAIDATLGDGALVIVTSDHGEELFEHGGLEHGRTLYEEVLDVPFVVAFPGRERSGPSTEPVSLLDVVPTVLDVAGLPVPDELPGRSLLRGGEPRRVRVATYAEDTHALSVDGRKLILGLPQGRAPGVHWPSSGEQLYDLRSDPREARDIAASDRAQVTQLGELLRDWLDHWPVVAAGGEEAVPEAGDRARLEALGYVGAER